MALGQQSGSGWGITGTEAIGSDLALNFFYEIAVTVHTGQLVGFTRQATLGLVDDGWGTIAPGLGLINGC